MLLFLLHLFSLLCVLPLPSGAVDYYVTPTEPPNPACPLGVPCHTLDWYAMNGIKTFEGDSGNITMLFLPGIHQLYHNFILDSFNLNVTGFKMIGILGETDIADNHVIITGNYAFGWANLNPLVASTNLEVRNLSFQKIRSLFVVVDGHFLIEHCYFQDITNTVSLESISFLQNGKFLIHDCNFVNISGSRAVYITTISVIVNVTNCKFSNNKASITLVEPQSVFLNCKFVNNSGSSVLFSLRANLMIVDSVFIDNLGSAIFMSKSNLTFSGTNIFMNNSANSRNVAGGGLSLYNSFVNFRENTFVSFERNTAQAGGAVYVAQVLEGDITATGLTPRVLCPFQLLDETYSNISINFRGNNATLGGNDIYGASLLDRCIIDEENGTRIYQIQEKLFHFHDNFSLSSVSSDSQRVCLCEDGKPNCIDLNKIILSMNRYPGETFTISAAIVGYDFGTTTGSVYAQIIDSGESNESNSFLANLQLFQAFQSPVCQNLIYTVHSRHVNKKTTMRLSAEPPPLQSLLNFNNEQDFLERLNDSIQTFREQAYIDSTLLRTPVFVNITLLPCPQGFQFDRNDAACVCDSKLREIGVSCLIEDGVVSFDRSGAVWLNPSYQHENVSDIVFHLNCLFSYCEQKSILIHFDDPDLQCANNHLGTLCGACRQNYSLALGSNRCLSCADNSSLSLIIFFVFAGFALVFFIKFLDLTVARGTINGLIFYANIVWANEIILFPETTNAGYDILRVFIAWLNLDFGIETCFVQGLDAYWKTWLQFVFPLYVWSIVGIIILACRISSKLTKFWGKNIVPLLATLFFLSYAKLLRTIITVYTSARIESLNGSTVDVVWSFDGNISYFNEKHTPLFIVAVALLFLWLPYTIILFSIQWLKRFDHYRFLRWTRNLKPFFDAYFGPLKDKHHYWIGLLLFYRILLLVLFSTTFTIAPNFSLLAIALVITLIFIHLAYFGGIYKVWYLSFLNNVSYLNLVVLSVGTLYIKTDGNEAAARVHLVYTSVGVALLQFVVIIFLHLYTTFKPVISSRVHFSPTTREKLDKASTLNRASLSSSYRLRESLLDDDFNGVTTTSVRI